MTVCCSCSSCGTNHSLVRGDLGDYKGWNGVTLVPVCFSCSKTMVLCHLSCFFGQKNLTFMYMGPQRRRIIPHLEPRPRSWRILFHISSHWQIKKASEVNSRAGKRLSIQIQLNLTDSHKESAAHINTHVYKICTQTHTCTIAQIEPRVFPGL